jgi:hypothetical protein
MGSGAGMGMGIEMGWMEMGLKWDGGGMEAGIEQAIITT